MSWENFLRMLRLHRVPMPDQDEDPALTKAKGEVEQLHRKAEKVLDDYAAAEAIRKRGPGV